MSSIAKKNPKFNYLEYNKFAAQRDFNKKNRAPTILRILGDIPGLQVLSKIGDMVDLVKNKKPYYPGLGDYQTQVLDPKTLPLQDYYAWKEEKLRKKNMVIPTPIDPAVKKYNDTMAKKNEAKKQKELASVYATTPSMWKPQTILGAFTKN